MRLVTCAAAFTLGSLLAMSSAQAAGPIQAVKVGNWNGGSYTNDKTGVFSHCAAGATYQSGIYFMVSVNRLFQWSLGFASPAWQLAPGQSIPVDLTFDGHSQYHVFATAISPQLVEVGMPDNSALIRTFRAAKEMQPFAQGRVFPFVLTNTSEVLPALVACVRQSLGMPTAAAKPPKRAKPIPPVSSLAPGAPTVAMPAAPGTSPEALSADAEIEAINLATRFMLKSQLSNPQILARKDTPVELASYGAAWKADGAFGAVRVIPPQEGMKGIDLAAAVAEGDAKECKGKFLSGRTADLVDSDVVFRGFSTCEDSNGTRSSLYFIVPHSKGGFVLFSVVTTAKPDAPEAPTPERKLSDYRKAALTSVSE
jgi:hypothetical protein